MAPNKEPLPPALKGFLINMIKETMYDAGYSVEAVTKHLAETESTIDSLSVDEVSLQLLRGLSDDVFLKA